MNLHLQTTTRGEIPTERFVFLDTEHAADEDAELDRELVDAARAASSLLSVALGGKGSVSVRLHETLEGSERFRPAYIEVTASRLDPLRHGELERPV